MTTGTSSNFSSRPHGNPSSLTEIFAAIIVTVGVIYQLCKEIIRTSVSAATRYSELTTSSEKSKKLKEDIKKIKDTCVPIAMYYLPKEWKELFKDMDNPAE